MSNWISQIYSAPMEHHHVMDHEHTTAHHHDDSDASGQTGMDECNSMDHSGHGMMMMMTFHTGYCETVLFDSWKVSSIGGLLGSMIGIFIMAALYEGLKYYREYLFWKTYSSLQYRAVSMPAEKRIMEEDNRIVQPTMFSLMHGVQTFLHIIQIVLSYFLMLIFMTYNVWLCLAVVIGAAVGYFLFGWKKSVVVDVTEHCH
ncbi:high affinity copper uptake protein 1-like isoform X2 [Zootermopsis nevadensis]|uniref:high affinity copper uptake protein 1-like isoform X2 n=1 Tax=Zootermopsis nevadensis TaxID=136037 RepID=UPI000B8EB8DF|nr:high affinity copper uptake protein 1-like isoform X2 [Zootermopsis nevadensis]